MRSLLRCPPRLPSAFAFALAAACSLLLPATLPAAPGIANVRASQRAGTTLVDIRYDLGTANSLIAKTRVVN